ncbi:hypothetical protein ABF87_14490 [Nitrosomonas sp. JL21]|uniref:hypothetical protein n=1 Tax=Nitrosomonas sp. JL21 TaxID=153949 RepID=UPI00136F2690|nr:hypothetical protein [Nitrosomonas sp. JL21]MBL8497387.1 hypothetical protein [Nitrosomonas sp.]MXS79143.1 hypothetical protein [Nitrosomonas sp. JL21]
MKVISALLSILIVLIILSFPINYFKQSPLVREIAQLEPPVRFLDEVRFDSLVQKYIPLGIEKEHAIRQLESYGFDIIKSDEVPRLLECEQCDKEYVYASYQFKNIYIIPSYLVSIQMGFQNGRVSIIAAVLFHNHDFII